MKRIKYLIFIVDIVLTIALLFFAYWFIKGAYDAVMNLQ